jgi:hypothetical protein
MGVFKAGERQSKMVEPVDDLMSDYDKPIARDMKLRRAKLIR